MKVCVYGIYIKINKNIYKKLLNCIIENVNVIWSINNNQLTELFRSNMFMLHSVSLSLSIMSSSSIAKCFHGSSESVAGK